MTGEQVTASTTAPVEQAPAATPQVAPKVEQPVKEQPQVAAPPQVSSIQRPEPIPPHIPGLPVKKEGPLEYANPTVREGLNLDGIAANKGLNDPFEKGIPQAIHITGKAVEPVVPSDRKTPEELIQQQTPQSNPPVTSKEQETPQVLLPPNEPSVTMSPVSGDVPPNAQSTGGVGQPSPPISPPVDEVPSEPGETEEMDPFVNVMYEGATPSRDEMNEAASKFLKGAPGKMRLF